MSVAEERIKALEETVSRVKNAWYSVNQECERLQAENAMLRNQLNDIEGKMQQVHTEGNTRINEELPAGVVSGKDLTAVKKEIKSYVAEIDQCLEWLNSI